MEPTLSRRTVLKTAGALTLVNGGSSYASASAVTDRHGPVRTGRFRVEIDEVKVSGWTYVTIPASSTEQGEYREGDEPDWERKLWGQTTFDDLEMQRGIQPGARQLYDWREEVRQRNVDDGRKDVTITLLDEESAPQIRWEFENAWIKTYDPPTLDSGTDGVGTETVRLAFDTMTTDWDPDERLVSRIQHDPFNPTFGEEVAFDASESTPTGDIDDYEWEFGDGTTATGETVTHTITATGEYAIELTVTSGDETDSRVTTVDIAPPGLEYYADADGAVDDAATAEAFDHWEEGHIETDLLLEVINAGHDESSGEE